MPVKLLIAASKPIVARTVDISGDGMCLEVASVFGIPEQFRVSFDECENPISVRVIWREPRRLGVTFVDEPMRDIRAPLCA